MDLSTTSQDIPYLTAAQMVEVDRWMIREYHIELTQMMENAGRNLARLAHSRFLAGNPTGKKVVVLAGNGGNGGGALVAARRLNNWGAQVRVFLSRPAEELTETASHQLQIVQRMGIPASLEPAVTQAGRPDLVIDGLIGYSLKGNPRGTAADLIRWANRQPAPVLALDIPSGVDATTGTVYDPAIQATATMTLALPKEGLRAPSAKLVVGELYLADISVPPQLYRKAVPGITVGALFAESDIIRLW